MTNNLCGFKTLVALKKLRIMLVLSFIAFFMLFFYSLPTTFYGPITPILMLLIAFIFIEKKNLGLALNEKILVWLHYYILAQALLIPIIIVTDMPIIPNYIIRYPLYALATILIIFLCQKLDLNKLFVFVLRRTPFKILFFIIGACFFIFSMTSNYLKEILDHHLLLFLFSIPTLIALFYLIKRIHKSTALMPESYHDAKNLMMLLNIKAAETTTISELRTLLDESINLIDLQLPTPGSLVADTEEERFEKFMKQVIEVTKVDKKAKVSIVSDVQFTNRYPEINDIKLAYMLRLLLEYTLDILTQKPIYVDIQSSSDQIIINISYEYKHENSLENLELFLVADEIPQSNRHNHFNLLRLRSLITDHHGKTTIIRQKNTQEQADYLSVCLIFKKECDDVE